MARRDCCNIFLVLLFARYVYSNKCPQDKWGELCNSKCGNCMKPPCDKTTGHCIGGCSGPWLPPHCTQECKSGSYGVNCSETCGHCKEGSLCDIRTGQCQQECEPGWQGNRCDKECSAQRFGNECIQRCYCYNGVDCSKGSGECPGDCSPGYHGKHCDKECATGYYGQDCSYRCGMCSKNETCNAETGTCYNGCMTGYTEPYCKSKHEATSVSPHNLPHFLSWILIPTMALIQLWDIIASFH
ncbi:multiple epidermal growth factor-like domains protein 10 [Ruditapes philippinarum]|uniref:multiple epidermal growth factor-like domains protein 10 n=1 Tax=Ruditapes philippinarum TaxID=129788 RepID=UPI00295B1621|nr:multiple epidermal growth factor-like domains protein 10 [Ruditapes philippinarum]